MSVTISVRVDDEVKKEIEELGYNPSEYVRKILIQELKKERSWRAIAWLEAHRLPPGEKSAEEEIREDRDSR
ncbi:MAG: antitoxin [Candidatus Methanofastidiosia archaeon]